MLTVQITRRLWVNPKTFSENMFSGCASCVGAWLLFSPSFLSIQLSEVLTMPIIKLFQQEIDALQCPASKARIEYCDKNLPGLYVLVSSKSSIKSFFLRYKDNNGKTCHQKLGRTTDIDLDEARRRAKKLKAELLLGIDRWADEKATKVVLTLDQAVKEFVFPNLHRLRSVKKYEQMYNLRISQILGATPVNAVNRAQILAFHTSLVKEENLSPATANRYLAMLRRCFSLLVELDLLESNPASRIQLYPESGVEHYLETAELKRLLKVLQTDKNRTVCLIALFLLSTGARLNEALQAKWKDINRENKVWRIPASNSKNKRVRSLALNNSAVSVLDQLHTEGTYEYLFINRKTGNSYVTIHKTWTRLRKAAGLPHLRIHDLRHQYASFLVNSGRTLYEVAAALGHRDASTSQKYAHLSSKTLQEAADCASDIITSAMPK
jgi:integrase